MAFLNASDIVDLAMQVEKNGEAFYRAVAKETGSPQIRALFEDLADQETKHYATFSRLAQTVREKPLMTAEEWDDYLKYMNATVQSAFFEGPDKALAAAHKVKDEKEAVRLAMGFEKETLLFFYDLRDAIQGSERSFVEKIVSEEKAHIRRLATVLLG
jgi:rubrerythrin